MAEDLGAVAPRRPAGAAFVRAPSTEGRVRGRASRDDVGDVSGTSLAWVTDPSTDQPAAFISYCHQDEEIAIAVQAALEGHEWFAFRDQTDVLPGDPLPRELAEAVDRAELFLAIISDDYTASRAC